MAPPERLLVVACGALAREITALQGIHGWTHMTLVCLPAILHNRPDRIPAAVSDAIAQRRVGHDRVFVAYGDCGTGGRLAELCDEIGATMIDAPHCYAFYEGAEAFRDHADEIDAFYLTDFLARQFDAFVWRPLGLDRNPALRGVYFAHYTKLVYLAQTDDPALTNRAADAAHRLGLVFERRFTGYGELGDWIAQA
jgi:hypothetical protein